MAGASSQRQSRTWYPERLQAGCRMMSSDRLSASRRFRTISANGKGISVRSKFWQLDKTGIPQEAGPPLPKEKGPMVICGGCSHDKAHCLPDSSDVGCHTGPLSYFRVHGSSQLFPTQPPTNLFQLRSFPAPVLILLITVLVQPRSALVPSWSSLYLPLSLSTHASTHDQVRSAGHIQSTEYVVSLFALDSSRCLWLSSPSYLKLSPSP